MTTTRSPTPSPSRSARPRAWCCTPATSSSTSCRSTAGSPTWRGSPASATRASTCSSSTPPTPRSPGFVTAEQEIGPVLDGVFHRVAGRIIVACFAATCTASSRCSRRGRARPRSAWWAAPWCATWASRPISATSTSPTGCSSTWTRRSTLPDDQVMIVSTGRRASRCPPRPHGPRRPPSVRIRAEDTVILASSLIPGNETAVFTVINGLTRLGAAWCTRARRRCTSPGTHRR